MISCVKLAKALIQDQQSRKLVQYKHDTVKKKNSFKNYTFKFILEILEKLMRKDLNKQM